MHGSTEFTNDYSSLIGQIFFQAGVHIGRKYRTPTIGLNMESQGNVDLSSIEKTFLRHANSGSMQFLKHWRKNYFVNKGLRKIIRAQ